VRLGLVVEGVGGVSWTCPCGNLSMTTHPLKHRGLELDRQETSVAECV
jgi:hypothetical protein